MASNPKIIKNNCSVLPREIIDKPNSLTKSLRPINFINVLSEPLSINKPGSGALTGVDLF